MKRNWIYFFTYHDGAHEGIYVGALFDHYFWRPLPFGAVPRCPRATLSKEVDLYPLMEMTPMLTEHDYHSILFEEAWSTRGIDKIRDVKRAIEAAAGSNSTPW